MRKVVLIKHSHVEVREGVPSEEWALSEEGRRRCEALAEVLRRYDLSAVVSSRETKARETGQIVAARLGVPAEVADGLEEHHRRTVPVMRTSEFISLVALFFKRRGERVLGEESADEAMLRVKRAVGRVLERHPEGNVGIVTHGTVLSLLLEHYASMDGYGTWRRLQLPSFVVVELPGWKVEEVVEAVGGGG